MQPCTVWKYKKAQVKRPINRTQRQTNPYLFNSPEELLVDLVSTLSTVNHTTASLQNATIYHILWPEWWRGVFLNPWIFCGHSLKLKIKIGQTGRVLNERGPHPFQLANPNKHSLKNTHLYRIWNLITLIIIVINSFFFFFGVWKIRYLFW